MTRDSYCFCALLLRMSMLCITFQMPVPRSLEKEADMPRDSARSAAVIDA